jgi:hypothetical protein
MSGFKRGTAACLLVHVTSESAPALHRHCPRCKEPRRFVSAGKFRVNAQKKRIDAWLIFRCTICDDRWNWPIHERRPVGALDPAELDALMRNDHDLATRHAQAAMRECATTNAPGQIEGPTIALTILAPATADTRTVEIIVAGYGLRLDRLLAQALMLGRREVEALDRSAAISISPATRKALRRPAIDGQRICIDLSHCSAETAARLRQRLAVQPPSLYC